MIERNLAEQILFSPIGEGADTLRILSGYATPNMASWLIKNLQEKKLGPIKIQLVIGMTVYNGMSVDVHKGFVELQKTIIRGSHSFLADMSMSNLQFILICMFGQEKMNQ